MDVRRKVFPGDMERYQCQNRRSLTSCALFSGFKTEDGFQTEGGCAEDGFQTEGGRAEDGFQTEGGRAEDGFQTEGGRTEDGFQTEGGAESLLLCTLSTDLMCVSSTTARSFQN